jgi:myo-inositol-1(or 4)-monophosphatase
VVAERNDWQQKMELIMHTAGQLLLSFYGKPLVRMYKSDTSFATQADKAVEEFLIVELSTLLPQAGFCAEESGMKGMQEGYCWVIDPLDGTTNFAHRLPYFCISVALTYNKVPVIGSIHNPITKEIWFAQVGKGAFLNGEKIAVSQPRALDESVIAARFPYDMQSPLTHAVLSQAHTVYAIRHCGSIALDMAYVASGRLDGALFNRLSWWDVAAGILLIQQAGGNVTTFEGQELNPEHHSCVAGGILIYNALRAEWCSKTIQNKG